MLFEHDGKRPVIAHSAYVAPNAVVCGDVRIGQDCQVLFGAVLVADGGPVELGDSCVVMENALIRGRSDHPAQIGDRVLVGPHAHLNGTTVESDVFIATGASLFPCPTGLIKQAKRPRPGVTADDFLALANAAVLASVDTGQSQLSGRGASAVRMLDGQPRRG